MRNQLVVNSATVNYIKQGSFRYVEQVAQDGLGLRFGSAYASYIEGEAYYKPDGTSEINDGDVIVYNQILDVDSDFVPLGGGNTYTHTIGIFTVKKVVRGKKSYFFSAYDNLDALNINFSTTLYSNRNNFPMTINAFLELVRDTALNNYGITVNISECTAYNMLNPNDQLINYFYADGLTIRDILMYFADLTLQYIKCDANGIVHFKRYSTSSDSGTSAYWKNSDRYIISPTDQVAYTGTAIINGSPQTVNLVPVFYKQDGLEREAYSFETTTVLYTKDINGKSLWSVVMTPQHNPYAIQKNILIGNMLLTNGINNLCVPGWNALQTLTTNYSISPVEVHLFPFRNPFNAGQILTHIEDVAGNRFSSVVMKMEQTDSEVIITCSGTETYYTSALENYDADDDAASLNVALNSLATEVSDKVPLSDLPLSIANGGTGQSAVETETTISNIATAGTRFSLTSASYKVWGKVSQIVIGAKCITAVAAGTNIATIASGKRPASVAGAITRDTTSPYASEATIINTGGTIPCAKSYAVNDEFVVYSTYLLP